MRFAQTDPDILSPSDEEQLARVLRGGYALLIGADQYWQHLHCHLSLMVVPGFQKATAFYLQKNSPYTGMISKA